MYASLYENIFVLIYLRLRLEVIKELLLLCYMAKKKAAGRPESEDKREPFNLRLKSSVLDNLRNRAKNEGRAMNTIAERILENELR